MNRSIDALVRHMREPVRDLIRNCSARGIVVVPFSTLRDPWEQAKIWRSTRGKQEITDEIKRLKANGAHFIAKVIASVGPQYPETGTKGHLTNAVPGQTWHNWAEACDFYVKNVDGSVNWDGEHEDYEVLAEEAEALGLFAGLRWNTPDPVHIQSEGQNPYDFHGSWAKLDTALREKWEDAA